MNQTYAVRGTTLTALGDVVRDKVGQTKFITRYADTVNVEWIHDKGIDYKSSSMWGISDEFAIQRTIFGLTKVKIHISEIESNGQFRFLVENATSGSNNVCDNYYNNGNGPIDLEFTDKFDGYVRVRLIAMGYTTWVKFTYTIEYYDFNDNPIGYQEEVKNTMTLQQMAGAIEALQNPIPDSQFTVTGDCDYRFAGAGRAWIMENLGHKYISNNISRASYMFTNSDITELSEGFTFNFANGGVYCGHMFQNAKNLKKIPAIDFKQTSARDASYMFEHCDKLKEIGTLSNLYPSSLDEFIRYCYYLRHWPETVDWDWTKIQSGTDGGDICSSNYSLREIPEDFLKNVYSSGSTGYYANFLSGAYRYLYSLDELNGLVPYGDNYSSNIFSSTFSNASRVKKITFALQEDGSPYVVTWKNQVIDLTADKYIGYAKTKSYITDYNSGITRDKEVTDDATYQALKDDPDWFTLNIAYSRFNHDSAVALINSLPDTSAYSNGTNTVKFAGASGSATDGGAINTLTEEEIAVATAKGWTVQIV